VRLFVVDRNGAHLHPITRYGITVQAPAWSPDGTWIAFTGKLGPHNIGMLVHPDGTAMHKILGNASEIAWRR
jgi:Tol biopolymer transport system component